jgi:protein-tyrosine phosphatase
MKRVRQLLVALRDDVDRRLHATRRRSAEGRLQQIAPRSILFVCLGNVCRSPYAERFLAQQVGPRLDVDSAGFIGPGRPPPEHAIEAARASGVDHGDHRSKTLTPVLLEAADAIFVFDRNNMRRLGETRGIRPERVFWLGDFDPRWAGRRAISDPWGQPLEVYLETFVRIEQCVGEVIRTLQP